MEIVWIRQKHDTDALIYDITASGGSLRIYALRYSGIPNQPHVGLLFRAPVIRTSGKWVGTHLMLDLHVPRRCRKGQQLRTRVRMRLFRGEHDQAALAQLCSSGDDVPRIELITSAELGFGETDIAMAATLLTHDGKILGLTKDTNEDYSNCVDFVNDLSWSRLFTLELLSCGRTYKSLQYKII